MRETETRGALRPPQSRRRAENSTPRTRSEKKKLNLSPNPITFISHTGLVGVLPKLLEKDLHRIITGWANEFGPVFKLRVMQFHVSRESFCSFFLFLVFSSLSFPSRAKPRRVSPLSLSLARALSTNLSPKKKKPKTTGHRHHRPGPGHARLPLQAARQVPLPVPLYGRGEKRRRCLFFFPLRAIKTTTTRQKTNPHTKNSSPPLSFLSLSKTTPPSTIQQHSSWEASTYSRAPPTRTGRRSARASPRPSRPDA